MPYFKVADLKITPKKFVESCSHNEIKEIILALIEEEYILKSDINPEIFKKNIKTLE